MLPIAINHASAPRLSWRELLDAAAKLGCAGVEFRNDLGAPLFSGDPPEAVAAAARAKGLRVVCLGQVHPFNPWTDAVADEASSLIAEARSCGAEAIALVPRNDGTRQGDGERQADLRLALREIRPMLEEAGMTALVEPLGFARSSLRSKAEAIEAIEAVAGRERYMIAHDTFHHFLAGETEVFPEWTGIAHVSGVADPRPGPGEMEDGHRELVDARDRLGSVGQLAGLAAGGYAGPVSMEAFSPEVHGLADPVGALGASFEFVRGELAAKAA